MSPISDQKDDAAGTKFVSKFCIAFVAASVAETVTYPLDLTKTRMQIQGEMRAKELKLGMFKTAFGIVRNEGLFQLWTGLSPALYRHVIYSGLRMSLYESLRDNVLKKDSDGSFPLWKAAIGGLIAGGFAQFTASPMDLVKVQLQMEGKRKLQGLEPRVKSVPEALTKIYREAGIRGLWKGTMPNVARGALVNLGDLSAYDSAKRFLLQKFNMTDGIHVHAIASFIAGFSAALMGTPADVIKTRIMQEPTVNGKGIYYKNSLDCVKQTIRNEGFFALYKGFFPIWLRLGPWSVTFWITFEWIRGISGVSSF